MEALKRSRAEGQGLAGRSPHKGAGSMRGQSYIGRWKWKVTEGSSEGEAGTQKRLTGTPVSVRETRLH